MLGQGGQKIASSVERVVLMERGWRPNTEAAPNCPRCDSTNTKFCYYNNYSLTQPRYFCKTCRRYWTKGGSLRNVPVGGGCRKNRRSKSARTAVDRDPATMMDSRSLSSDSDPSRNLHGGFSEIDLALVYEKYVSQQPDQVLYNFDHSQPICSQPNSGPLLPDLSADIRLDFEIGIDRNAYDFGEVQGGNEVGVQLQTYCDQGAVDLFHEFRGDGSYEPDGFQYDLGLHQVTNPTFPNPNLQHHLMEEVPRVENFSFCPDFVPNCWSSTDLHSYGSLFHIQHIQKDKR